MEHSDTPQAYRQLALRHHPDKASDALRPAAETIFKYVQTSYAVLSDAAARRKYDSSVQSARFRYHSRPYSAGAF